MDGFSCHRVRPFFTKSITLVAVLLLVIETHFLWLDTGRETCNNDLTSSLLSTACLEGDKKTCRNNTNSATYSNNLDAMLDFGAADAAGGGGDDDDDERAGNDDNSFMKSFYAMPRMDIFIYVAHWDDRLDDPVIRVFGLRPNSTILDHFSCVISVPDGATVSVAANVSDIYSGWPKVLRYYAFMMVCRLSSRVKGWRPAVVRMTSADGDHVTLPVTYSRRLLGKKKEFAVCVKPIHGEFDVIRIMEWFEIQKAAGVNDFILYDADVHGASRYVIGYYERAGAATVVRFPYLLAVLRAVDRTVRPDPQLRYSVYQQIYLLGLHDCVYRFRRSYDFLVVIDLDEVLLPTNDESLAAMLHRLRKDSPDFASYVFPTVWHFREFRSAVPRQPPSLLYMQTYAAGSAAGWIQPKSIISTNYTVTLNYHVTITSIRVAARHELQLPNYGLVHHFRDGSCRTKFTQERPDTCERMRRNVRLDPAIRRYNIVTLKNVFKVMKRLQLS